MAEGPRESSEELDSECLFSPTCGKNICIDGCTAKWIKNDSGGRFFIDKSLSSDEEIILTFSGKGHAEVGIISIDPITIKDVSHVGNIKELTVIQTARIYKQEGTTKIKRSKEGDRIITDAEGRKSRSRVDKEQSIWITVNILFGDLKVQIGSKGYKFSPNKGENVSKNDEYANLKYPYPCAVCFVMHPLKRGDILYFQADDINKVGAPSKNCSFKLAISKSNPEEFMSSADKYCDITHLSISKNFRQNIGRIQLRCGLKERQSNADYFIPIVEEGTQQQISIDQQDVPDSVYMNSKQELNEIRYDAEEISIYSDDYNPVFESRNIVGASTDTLNEPTTKCTNESTTTELGADNRYILDNIESLSSRLFLIEENINKMNIGKESTIQSSEMQDLRSEIKEIKTLLTEHSINTDGGKSNVSNHRTVTPQTDNSKPLKERIQDHFQMLVSMLEINPVLDCLYQAKKNTLDYFQRLRQLSSGNMAEANRELLSTISRRQNLDTEFFEDILIKSKQDGILAVMFPHQSNRKQHAKKGLMDGPSDKEIHRLKNSKMDNFKGHVKEWLMDSLIDKEIYILKNSTMQSFK
ncbi:Hypothetical predicted protein, partial [Mytilus galloprovincialis]